MEFGGSNEMILLKEYPEILNILLFDNTTKKNIIWATNNYEKRGKGYSSKNEIKLNLINSKAKIIKPRIEKSKTEQLKRSKDKAEVFTSSWIVNKQNNLVDNNWFKKENVFNKENEDKTWNITKKIIFPEDKHGLIILKIFV